MMLLDAPEQLRCLWRHLRLLISRNFIQGTTTNEQISLFLLWMATLMRQQSNLQLLPAEKLQLLFLNHQPNWLELVLHGEWNQGHSTGEVCWKYFCLYFGFYL